jgi:hypothetical protein
LSETSNSLPPPGAQPLWGAARSSGGAGAPGAPRRVGGTELEPLSQRLLRVVGLLSVLLLLVVANSLLRGGSESLTPVAAAAARAENIAGARFTLDITYSSPVTGRTITARGTGVTNSKTDRGRAVIDVDSPETGSIHIVSITDYEYTSGSPGEVLPPGKLWVKKKKGSEGDSSSPDLSESLEMLSKSGNERLVGHEAVDGRMTRRYRSEIDLGTFIGLLRDKGEDQMADAYERIEGIAPNGVVAEGWVDRKNLLRRLRVVMPSPGKEGQLPLTVDMRMDIRDYGIKPHIKLPDPSTVVDSSAVTDGSGTSQIS